MSQPHRNEGIGRRNKSELEDLECVDNIVNLVLLKEKLDDACMTIVMFGLMVGFLDCAAIWCTIHLLKNAK